MWTFLILCGNKLEAEAILLSIKKDQKRKKTILWKKCKEMRESMMMSKVKEIFTKWKNGSRKGRKRKRYRRVIRAGRIYRNNRIFSNSKNKQRASKKLKATFFNSSSSHPCPKPSKSKAKPTH